MFGPSHFGQPHGLRHVERIFVRSLLVAVFGPRGGLLELEMPCHDSKWDFIDLFSKITKRKRGHILDVDSVHLASKQ